MADLAAEMARFEAELAGVVDSSSFNDAPSNGRPGPQPGHLPPPPAQHAYNEHPPVSTPYNMGRPMPMPPPPGPPQQQQHHQQQQPQQQPTYSMPPPPMMMQPPMRPPPMMAPPRQEGPPASGGYTVGPALGMMPPQASYLPPARPAYIPQPAAADYAPSTYPDPSAYAVQQMFSAPVQAQAYPAYNYTAPVAAAPAAAAKVVSSVDALREVREAFQAQGKGKTAKTPAVKRQAAGKTWWDPSLVEWDPNDFRIFVGDMGSEVNDEILSKAFSHYSSFVKGKMVRNKQTNKNKGYGFVSFSDAIEGAKALREMNGKYVGNRPCKLSKSTWDERSAQPAGKRKGGAQPDAPNKKKAGLLHR